MSEKISGKAGMNKVCLIFDYSKNEAYVFSNQKQALTLIGSLPNKNIWEWKTCWGTPFSIDTLSDDNSSLPWRLLVLAHTNGNWHTKIPFDSELLGRMIEEHANA